MSPPFLPLPVNSELVETMLRSAPAGVAVLDLEGRVTLASVALGEILGMDRAAIPGCLYADFFEPESREQIRAAVAAPEVDSRARTLRRILRPDGQTRDVELIHYPVRLADRHLVVFVALDVTEGRRLVHKIRSLSQFVSGMAYAGSLEATLTGLAQRVVEATAAQASSVTILDNGQFSVPGAFGLPPGYPEALTRLHQAGGLVPSEMVARTREPMVVHELLSRMPQEAVYAEIRALAEGQRWQTLVSLPMGFGEHCFGSLNAYYGCAEELGESEMTFLQTLADLAGVAVQNAHLLGQARQRAVLEERQRLARELHDSVSQALYALILAAHTARAELARSPAAAEAPLDYVYTLAQAAHQEMQALIYALRPECLEQEGLVAALSRQAESLRARHGLAVTLELKQETELAADLQHALFRIASEALHNVVKHARAERVEVRLDAEAGALVLEIVDDGRGFDPDADYPGHMGLVSMRERAEDLGGSLTISSTTTGTRVVARVPVSA